MATTTVGVISDTHGLLRPEAVTALAGSDVIVHAGDVGRREVVDALRELAPRLIVVRGNVDQRWAHDLPETADFELAGRRFHVLHNLATLGGVPSPTGLDVVISGHSHRPVVERREGVLYVNPGSAGPRRFRLPVTLARIVLTQAGIAAEIVPLLP